MSQVIETIIDLNQIACIRKFDDGCFRVWLRGTEHPFGFGIKDGNELVNQFNTRDPNASGYERQYITIKERNE